MNDVLWYSTWSSGALDGQRECASVKVKLLVWGRLVTEKIGFGTYLFRLCAKDGVLRVLLLPVSSYWRRCNERWGEVELQNWVWRSAIMWLVAVAGWQRLGRSNCPRILTTLSHVLPHSWFHQISEAQSPTSQQCRWSMGWFIYTTISIIIYFVTATVLSYFHQKGYFRVIPLFSRPHSPEPFAWWNVHASDDARMHHDEDSSKLIR